MSITSRSFALHARVPMPSMCAPHAHHSFHGGHGRAMENPQERLFTLSHAHPRPTISAMVGMGVHGKNLNGGY